MRRLTTWVAVAVVAGLCCTGRAQAARPTCDDLLSAVASGRSRAQVAEEFGTTETRVSTCEALAASQKRQSARREHFEARRLERGLPLDE